MAILLQNLLARSPKLTDLPAITALFATCAREEDGPCDCSDSVEVDVLANWRSSDFNLVSDAWVITTKQGQVVSYADIWMNEQCQIEMRVRVHPEYGRRGIGTLLLRLGEDRARSYVRRACPHTRITLSSVVSIANSHAQELLEQEGYLPVQHIWRVSIKSDEMSGIAGTLAHGIQTFDLYVDPLEAQECVGIVSPHHRTGIYSARTYVKYEKELRSNAEISLQQELFVAA
jgi:GNAT superfamily N-acetyltransferase